MSAPVFPDDSILEPFDIFEVVFKTVDEHKVETAILIPKGLKQGVHPVILNFHGGFLINGHSLFAPYMPPWVIQLATRHGAILVSPDYRLLPSKNGVADVLEDLEDFWQWVQKDLTNVLQERVPGHIPNVQRLLVTGASAGGYCAIQVALDHSEDIKAVAMTYPEIDIQDSLFVNGPKDGEPTVFRAPLESMLPKDAVLSWIEDARQSICTKSGFERSPYALSVAQHGLYISHVFDHTGSNNPNFDPIEKVNKGARLPKRIWIMHGNNDSLVYIRGTYRFIDVVKAKLPNTVVRLDVAEGKDHGFDHFDFETWESDIEDAKGAMTFVEDAWLKD